MSMKIYTRTGDEGETGLFGGGRVPKDHPRVAAYGDVDELNSVLGVVRATEPVHFFDDLLESVQRDLFAIGGHLATPDPEKVAAALEKAELSQERVEPVRAGHGCGRPGAAAAPRVRAAGRHAQGRGAPPGAHGLPPRGAERGAAWRTRRRCPRCSSSTSIACPICCSPWPAWPTTATARAT